MRVDVEGNDLLYGGGTPPAAILSGDVAQPMNLVAPLLKVSTQCIWGLAVHQHFLRYYLLKCCIVYGLAQQELRSLRLVWG